VRAALGQPAVEVEAPLPRPPEVPEGARVTLAQSVSIALARNPTMQTALDEIHRANALLEQARAASLPTITGSVSYVRNDHAREAATGEVTVPIGQFGASATLAVPLVAPRAWVQWSHADDNIDVARASAAETRRVVAVAVARAYLAIVAEKRVIEAAVRARDTDNAHYFYAHQRYVGGIGNRIDEVRADQQRQSDEAAVEQAYATLVREREALGVLVGAGGALDAVEPNLEASIDPQQAMRDAEHRTDVVAGQMRWRAADHTVRDNWADYAPTLSGSFQPFYFDPRTITQPENGWTAQVLLTVPFYDGGLRYGLAKERSALRDEAQAALDQTLRQARSDVRTAFEEVKRADAALVSSRQAADLARTALELAEMAYRAGAATNIEVIDAERTARDAETAVAVAEDGARQARLDLLAATGRFP